MVIFGSILIFCLMHFALSHVHGSEETKLNPELDDEWLNFKTKFSKSYETRKAELERRQIWEKNLKYINNHNRLVDEEATFTFRMRMNSFGDLVIYSFFLNVFVYIITI